MDFGKAIDQLSKGMPVDLYFLASAMVARE